MPKEVLFLDGPEAGEIMAVEGKTMDMHVTGIRGSTVLRFGVHPVELLDRWVWVATMEAGPERKLYQALLSHQGYKLWENGELRLRS